MEILFTEALDIMLMVIVAAAVFEAARRFAVYGTVRRCAQILVVCGVVTGMFVATNAFRTFKPPANTNNPREYMAPPNLSADTSLKKRSAAEWGYARSQFVQRGVLLEYTTLNGDRVRFAPGEIDIAARAGLLADESKRRTDAERYQIWGKLWWMMWIPLLLAGYGVGRWEYAMLVGRFQFSRIVRPQTFAEVEGFVGLLKAACEDPKMNSTLELILSQPDAKRKHMIRELVTQLRDQRAPQLLIDALVCLLDDEVAEKVYAFIHKCERPLVAVKAAA